MLSLFVDVIPAFLDGIRCTIELSAVTVVVALVLGTMVGLGRVLPVGSIRGLCNLYIEVLRSTPIPVILVFIFFALPELQIKLSPFVAASVGLSLYISAYVAEAVRSGINSVPPGHIEAARALGFRERAVITRVLLPEAFRAVVPTLGNLTVDTIKDTSIAYTIAVVEITGTTVQEIAKLAQPVPLFLLAAASYLLLTIPTGAAYRGLERRIAAKGANQ